MRVVVTGSNGLVGSRLALLLSERGHSTLGISRGEQRTEKRFSYAACELSDGAQLTSVLRDFRPEVVVHPASMTEVDRCEKDPEAAYAANVTAAANVAVACRELKAHLVHVSTDYVFDGEHGPYTEDDTPNPRGAYALTKHMGEQAVRVLSPSWAIARTAVVYGWPQAARPNFGAWLLGALKKGQPVNLFADQHVSPSLADNVALMLAELAERGLTGVWNIAGSRVVDRYAFGQALCEEFGLNPGLLVPTKLKDAKLASPRPLHSGLLVDKAARELTAKPWGLTESLRYFHECHRASNT
jgi:dTDP-4-dehydrorhamnose reductase